MPTLMISTMPSMDALLFALIPILQSVPLFVRFTVQRELFHVIARERQSGYRMDTFVWRLP